MRDNDLVEHIAKKIALGNNGGDWATHYTEHQKALWRTRAREIIKEVMQYMLDGVRM